MARSTANRVRNTAHLVKVLAGDVQAIQRGRYLQRIHNRIVGRAVGRLMRRVWR